MAAKKQAKLEREKRNQALLEDLRDDSIAIVKNSSLTFQQVHERGGPTAQTLGKWLYRETKSPHMTTIRSVLLACGYDFVIMPEGKIKRGISNA